MDSWPHAPPHQTLAKGTYMITAGTYHKLPHLGSRKRLRYFCELLFEVMEKFGWKLEAWASLSNHYHLIVHLPKREDNSISATIAEIHARSARFLNALDGQQGRKVWHNYFDTPLTFQKSYLARLKYVHQNPVNHGLVKDARDYPSCSAAWFEKEATPSFVKTVRTFKIDQLKGEDDY